MTDDEKKIVEAMKKCADVRLPEGFADRLAARFKSDTDGGERRPHDRHPFARAILIAASLTLILGFVPAVELHSTHERTVPITAMRDMIRSADDCRPDSESRLDALAFLGLCREIIRRRTRTLIESFRRHEDEYR